MREFKNYINGKWLEGKDTRTILAPFDKSPVAISHQASAEQMDEAIEASHSAFTHFRKISRFTRSRLLTIIAQEISDRRHEFAERIILEAGKPQVMADAEINRCLITFTLASEEAKRFGGEVVPLDIDAAGRAYSPAQSYSFPRGPVLAITPFNFPLNLMAHKLAPALAVGASVLLKPPPQAPGCAVLMAEIFHKAAKAASDEREKIPEAVFQVLSASNEVVGKAVSDPRLSTLSFTGSDKVGWMLQEKANRKKVILELGGNAGVIIHSDADLQRAASRCAFGGFAYAGQTCISVQRIYVHESVAEKFTALLLAETAKVKSGDPHEKGVIVGPLIDDGAATRIINWIEESKKEGAKVLAGGKREGNIILPTVMTGVKNHQHLHCEEVFGPVVVVDTYKDFNNALERVNDSRFGLQAGVFTDSHKLIQLALENLEVGGVTINEVPTYRADNMPYGGVKDSGMGREGVRYAMEDYCERKILVTWQG